MRHLIVIALAFILATSVLAFDLSPRRPDKPRSAGLAGVPSAKRQGGDTIGDAVAVSIPYLGSGTTVGYWNDYDEACPYTGSTAPDVVYAMTPAADIAVNVDMAGSLYDTKIYVRDADGNLIGCNDDYYPDYVSKLENLPLQQGVTYYLFIDGYGEEAGDYNLAIEPYVPCILPCPAGAELEGEPPLEDDYIDGFNGGCGSPDWGNPFSRISTSVFCGRSGWYLLWGGSMRDTDWHLITMPDGGVLEIVGDAEYPTYFFELFPQDCSSVAVAQNIMVGPCEQNSMTITGPPGVDIWFWVGPTTFDGPVNEYNYVVYSNLGPVVTEARSWSAVKSLYD